MHTLNQDGTHSEKCGCIETQYDMLWHETEIPNEFYYYFYTP